MREVECQILSTFTNDFTFHTLSFIGSNAMRVILIEHQLKSNLRMKDERKYESCKREIVKHPPSSINYSKAFRGASSWVQPIVLMWLTEFFFVHLNLLPSIGTKIENIFCENQKTHIRFWQFKWTKMCKHFSCALSFFFSIIFNPTQSFGRIRLQKFWTFEKMCAHGPKLFSHLGLKTCEWERKRETYASRSNDYPIACILKKSFTNGRNAQLNSFITYGLICCN